MQVYLDNAATTPIDKRVLAEMLPYLEAHFGNPSSIHSHGRKIKAAVERARKKVAELLNAAPAEIFFTSGGTESDNTALRSFVRTYGVQHIVTSKLEHHAVEHTAIDLEKAGLAKIHWLEHDNRGVHNLDHLRELLVTHKNVLVSLMHGNNEIGNLINLQEIGAICREHGAYFHSDTVQTMGHYKFDLQQIAVDALVGSAHKFHGPKGVGFLYLRSGNKINPLITGGAQERNMRAGTENVYGIVGLAKALELANEDVDSHRKHIEGLKLRMIAGLKEIFADVDFNGLSGDLNRSLYTVLNVSLPASDANEMVLMNLDIQGVSASGGSACSSGSDIGSHVLTALKCSPQRGAVRFSFSRFNTEADIDFALGALKSLYAEQVGR